MLKLWSTLCVLILISLLAACEVFATGKTTLVSISSTGVQGNSTSYGPSISSDGRYVAFSSSADNLVPGDSNESTDVFVHDRQTGQTTRVSISSTGVQGNSESYDQSISSDGRYVAFKSSADNLVAGDSNHFTDTFVHDRQTGRTTRVSVSSTGVQQGQGSEFWGTTRPSISSDGRYVAFSSSADNLVPGDSNESTDIFVHDRQTGQTTRVSVSSTGVPGNKNSYDPSISSDGGYVAFKSAADNLVADDSNGIDDIFVHDRQTEQTTRVSVSSTGAQGQGLGAWEIPGPSISSDGRYVAFGSAADTLVADDSNGIDDTFVHDRQTGQTTRVSVSSTGVQGQGLGWPGINRPSISADGRYVAFSSAADNLVAGDSNDSADVFVHDRQTGQTTRVSVSSTGVQGNGYSYEPSISSDGRYVAFGSSADNLILMPGQNYNSLDVFVHDRLPPALCECDLDEDGDCDGKDIIFFIAEENIGVAIFAKDFGNGDCP